MIISTQGIVLHTIKYGDTSVIAKIYTRELGMQSFLVKGVRGKSSAIRPSHLMPLNLLELVMNYRQNTGLQVLKELKCDPVLASLHYDMNKSSIAMFMKEILGIVLREEEKNGDLFDFLWSSIQILDIQQEKVTLYPLCFMAQLTRFMGFFPSGIYENEGTCFDLMEGCFVGSHRKVSAHLLEPDESEAISLLKESSYEKLHTLHLSSALRQKTLQNLLNYYRLHFHHFKELQSPLILREILSAGAGV